MSRPKENIIEVDKINFVFFFKEKNTSTKITKSFIDFYLDGKRYKLVVQLKADCV